MSKEEIIILIIFIVLVFGFFYFLLNAGPKEEPINTDNTRLEVKENE